MCYEEKQCRVKSEWKKLILLIMVVREGISEETLEQRPNEVRKAAMRICGASVPSTKNADTVLGKLRNNRRQVWLESSEWKKSGK